MSFMQFKFSVSITFEVVNQWLTVSLAVVRYVFICRHKMATNMFSLNQAKVTVLSVVLVCVTSSIPYYFLMQVKEDDSRPSCYIVNITDFTAAHYKFYDFCQWYYIVAIKMLPCVLLAISSLRLIYAMQTAKKRRRSLLMNTSLVITNRSSGITNHQRTTMVMIAVTLCSVVTTLPRGMLTLIAKVSGNMNLRFVLHHMDDLLMLLELINSTVNFLFYCTMSRKFRDTFKNLFRRRATPLNYRPSHRRISTEMATHQSTLV